MIDYHKDAADSEDEILSKLDILLNKHQNNIASNDNIKSPDFELYQTNELLKQIEEENISSNIPTLTEIVVLYSSPLRKILDAALEEINIDMNVTDRRILTRALQQRMTNQD